jgi:biotin carboxyl carrier protein
MRIDAILVANDTQIKEGDPLFKITIITDD